MSADRAVDASSAAAAREILKKSGPLPGINQTYFEHVVELMGSDPGASRALASRWRVFSKYGDDPALAMRAKAIGERIAGKWKTAGESFLTAAALAKGPLERAVFSIGAIDSFARAGEVPRAVEIGKKVARKLEEMGEFGQAGRARLNIGNALLFVDDYKGAARQYRRASELLEGTSFERDAAAAELGYSGAELYGGLVSESAAAAERAATAFEYLGDTHYADLARLNLAHCHLLQGRGDESREILREIAPSLLGSPSDAARCEEFLGDAYFRLNLFEEALDAYSSALSKAEIRRMPLNYATATFGQGLVMAAMGRGTEARKVFRRAAKMFGQLGNLSWQGGALAAEADVSTGKRAEALLTEAIDTLKRARSRYHLCLANISQAERFREPRSLRAAERLIVDNGYSFLRWRIDASKARWTHGARRLGHWRRMFESLLEERLLTRSTSSRSAFFRDKHSVIAEYLGELLDRKRPLVEEALSVVTRSRSAALVDELLAVEKPKLSGEAWASLEALRAAIAEESSPRDSGGSRRRTGVRSIPHLQRRWAESEFARVLWSTSTFSETSRDVAVFAETNSGYYCLHDGVATPLRLTIEDMRAHVRRIEFELLAPMVGLVDLASANAALAEARQFIAKGFRGEPQAILPEGPLWGLPWPALVDFEPVLRTNPLLLGNFKPKPFKRIVVWAHNPGDLPNVTSEVEVIAKIFPSAQVIETAVGARRSLQEPIDLLHVACHATTRVDSPMYSTLEMKDGPLLSAEIAKSGGNVRLATLSACDTGRVSLRLRTEPEGLVRSCLALRADAVVASLWPLDDHAGAVTMSSYYGNLKRTLNVRNSLAAARIEVRKTLSHPYYWAPLAIFGGYRRHTNK
ncbi:MAG: CHAT domain-containing tetratricopeptide repeat protein [Armatimonadota bacterium]|nr:CHAT domain-containing tetratricopeptide repeat protein [Armatimonadota bacterium]